MKQQITISGMNCEACVKLVTRKLSKVKNVEAVTVSLATHSAIIDSSQPVDISELHQALADTQYGVHEGANL